MENIIIHSFVIFTLIVLLTFLQKYHFKMLFYIASKYHSIFRFFIRFIIRFGIIVHELSHLFFGILSGAKIHKVELFREDGGRVTFGTKNYIGHLGQYGGNPGYLTKLFLNQIGIFLTSIGPLIVGMILTFTFIYYLSIPFDLIELKNLLLNSNTDINIYIFFLLYIIIIPSFILSFQDIKNFIISKQDTIGATIVGSLINSIIFICFLLFLTFFYSYFIVFSIFYLIGFLVLFIFWLINYIIYNYIFH